MLLHMMTLMMCSNVFNSSSLLLIYSISLTDVSVKALLGDHDDKSSQSGLFTSFS